MRTELWISFLISVCLFQPQTAQADLLAEMQMKPLMKISKNVDRAPVLFVNNRTGSHPSSEILLVEKNGKLLRKWKLPHLTSIAKLYPNSELIVSTPDQMPIPGVISVPEPKKIIIYDLKGKVKFEFEDSKFHHDFDLMPDGSLLAIRIHEVEESYASKIPGIEKMRAKFPARLPKTIWADEIVQIDRQKNVKVLWRQVDALKPKDYVAEASADSSGINAATGPVQIWDPIIPNEISHMNSVQYIDKNPIDAKPAVLLSSRSLSRILLVGLTDGKILWMSPAGLTKYQHDANLIDSQRVAVFDNGIENSRVLLINVLSSKIEKTINGGQAYHQMAQLQSRFVGSVQALENGNFLISEGTRGIAVEVSPNNHRVWTMFGPTQDDDRTYWAFQPQFRVKSYPFEKLRAWGFIK